MGPIDFEITCMHHSHGLWLPKFASLYWPLFCGLGCKLALEQPNAACFRKPFIITQTYRAVTNCPLSKRVSLKWGTTDLTHGETSVSTGIKGRGHNVGLYHRSQNMMVETASNASTLICLLRLTYAPSDVSSVPDVRWQSFSFNYFFWTGNRNTWHRDH